MSVLSIIGAFVVLLALWFSVIFLIDTKGSDMSIKDDILTLDNLFHSLVAVAFTVALGWLLPFDPLYAVLAGIGLYLREASQVGWDFTLRGSAHKHCEWAVGAVAALIASGITLWAF